MLRILASVCFFIVICQGFLVSQPLKVGEPEIENNIFKDLKTGYNCINSFSFLEATEVVNHTKLVYPKSAWPHLMQANLLWWKMITGEGVDPLETAFILELNQATQKAGNSDEGLFCSIMANTYLTRLELLKGNQLSALRHLKTYYFTIKKSFGLESRYEPFYVTSGLYFYLAAFAWNEYPLFRPLLVLFDRGDKAKGFSFLKKAAASHDPVVATEANYFLMRIFFDLEKNKETSLRYASWLVQKHPGNFIYLYYYFLCMPSDAINDEMPLRKAQVLRNPQLSEHQKAYFLFLLQKI